MSIQTPHFLVSSLWSLLNLRSVCAFRWISCCKVFCRHFNYPQFRNWNQNIRYFFYSIVFHAIPFIWYSQQNNTSVHFCNYSSVLGRVVCLFSYYYAVKVDLAIQAWENDPRGSSGIGKQLAFWWKLDSSNVSWHEWINHTSCLRLVWAMYLVCNFSSKTSIMDRLSISLGLCMVISDNKVYQGLYWSFNLKQKLNITSFLRGSWLLVIYIVILLITSF